MRLLVAVDTIKTLDVVLNAIEARSWRDGTEAHVLSVVEDDTIPAETWRVEGYGLNGVRREMRRRGELGVANRAHCSLRVVRRSNASRDKQVPPSRLKTAHDTGAGYLRPPPRLQKNKAASTHRR